MTTIQAVATGIGFGLLQVAIADFIGAVISKGGALRWFINLAVIVILLPFCAVLLPLRFLEWLYSKANPQEATQTFSTYTPLGEFEIDRNDE